jgi:hypothetical protein
MGPLADFHWDTLRPFKVDYSIVAVIELVNRALMIIHSIIALSRTFTFQSISIVKS